MIDKILLFPYYLTLKVRDRFYSRPGRKLHYADVPTLCIGNVTAGGTGKTPHVEMVLRLLQQSDAWGGRQLAVLSRGYKRESTGFQQVTPAGSASIFGDEPLQIKKKFPDVTVAVDKDRVEGCDAFQYRKLKAARNIVLVDYNRPVHKDLLLPLGRLRDLPERIYDADAVIVTKCPAALDDLTRAQFVADMGFTDYLPSGYDAANPSGRRQFIFFTTVRYGQAKGVYSTAEPRYLYAKKAILVTGIAGDGPLRSYLSDSYKLIKRFSFPDHHSYAWKDISRIQDAVQHDPTAAVLTTEKDAQRLLDYSGMPESLMQRLFQVPITVDFLSEDEREAFTDFIVHL